MSDMVPIVVDGGTRTRSVECCGWRWPDGTRLCILPPGHGGLHDARECSCAPWSVANTAAHVPECALYAELSGAVSQ